MRILHKFKSLLLFLTISFINGCSPSTTVTRIYLQDVEVTGPINQSPLHITDSVNYSITISPKFSFTPYANFRGQVDGHTKVNRKGVFQIDTILLADNSYYFRETPFVNNLEFTQQNLTWKIPQIYAALDIDLSISKSSAFFFGFNYSSENTTHILGGLAGIGFFKTGPKSAFRLDLGLNLQETFYDAYTIVTVQTTSRSESSDYVVLYHDRNKSSNLNPFFSLTYNTLNQDWLFNIFFSAGYNGQSILDFEPKTTVDRNPFYYEDVSIIEDLRGSASTAFIYATPGIYFNTGTGRILLGTRLIHETQMTNSERNFFVFPVVQFDFYF